MLMQLNWMHVNANWMHSVKLYMHLFKFHLHALKLYMHAVKLYLHAFHLYGFLLRITTLGETHIRSLSTQGSSCSQVYADRRCRIGGQVGDKRNITLEEATHAAATRDGTNRRNAWSWWRKEMQKKKNSDSVFIQQVKMHYIWINLCTL